MSGVADEFIGKFGEHLNPFFGPALEMHRVGVRAGDGCIGRLRGEGLAGQLMGGGQIGRQEQGGGSEIVLGNQIVRIGFEHGLKDPDQSACVSTHLIGVTQKR